MLENLYGMISLAVFTLLAVKYHIGHNEYVKKYHS